MTSLRLKVIGEDAGFNNCFSPRDAREATVGVGHLTKKGDSVRSGIAGPVLINYIGEYNVTHGVPKAQAYNVTMYIMCGLLVIGFIANFCI